METIIIFIVYLLFTFIATWNLVPFIKKMQWDVKSARVLLAAFVGIIGLLILALIVYFLDPTASKNVYSLTLIFGTIMVIINMGVAVFMMHFIRKMKYIQATFQIPGSVSKEGSLEETTMTCLVDRNQVLNIQKVFVPMEINHDLSKKQVIIRKEDVVTD